MRTGSIANKIKELESSIATLEQCHSGNNHSRVLDQATIEATRQEIKNLKIFEEDFSGSENEFDEMASMLNSTADLIISLACSGHSVQRAQVESTISELQNVIQNTEKELGIGSRIILAMKGLLDSLVAIGNLLCVGLEKGLSLINGNVKQSNELLGPIFKYKTTTEKFHDASVNFKGVFLAKNNT